MNHEIECKGCGINMRLDCNHDEERCCKNNIVKLRNRIRELEDENERLRDIAADIVSFRARYPLTGPAQVEGIKQIQSILDDICNLAEQTLKGEPCEDKQIPPGCSAPDSTYLLSAITDRLKAAAGRLGAPLKLVIDTRGPQFIYLAYGLPGYGQYPAHEMDQIGRP